MIAAAISSLATILSSANWHHGWGGPWFLLVPLFWVAVVVGIVWLIRGRAPWRRRHHWGPRPESADELLDRRFARGEIDAEEYSQRRSILDERQRG